MGYLKNFTKRLLIDSYHSKPGQIVWNSMIKQIQRPLFQKAFTRAYDQAYGRREMPTSTDIPFDRFNIDKRGMHALVVFPWLGESASSLYVQKQCETLRELGFTVHGLKCSTHEDWHGFGCFDTFHFVYNKNKNFYKWDVHTKQNLFERNNIDDWLEEDLLEEVNFLNKYYNFSLCLCNYVFYSAVLDQFSDDVIKILAMHDSFARRNERLMQAGVPHKNFFFSCSKDQEKKGLQRAQTVVAIQESEADICKKVYGIDSVLTIPFIPEINKGASSKKDLQDVLSKKDIQKESKAKEEKVLTIGYVGSSHAPNAIALQKFIKRFKKIRPDNCILKIVGGVSHSFSDDLNNGIKVEGFVPSLDNFYDSCDVFINPDTVVSGFKIKTIEAMAHGKPIVCTSAASVGLSSLYEEHNLCDAASVADHVCQILLEGKEGLKTYAKRSEEIYNSLRQKYSMYDIFNSLIFSSVKPKIKDIGPSESPLISVIVPCFKVERYLRQALLSLSNQTLSNIEIIAVDDGSPDGCRGIIEDFAKEDKRIIPLLHDQNGGYGHAINSGLKIAKGKYIAILEPDDWVEPDMLEVLYSNSENGKAEIVKAGFYRHFPKGNVDEKNFYFDQAKLKGQKKPIKVKGTTPNLFLGISSIWSAIYRRDFLVTKNILMEETPGASYQDVNWKMKTYLKAKEIILVPESIYHYREMSVNSSSKSSSKPLIVFENYSRLKDYLIASDLWQENKKLCAMHLYLDLVFHDNRLSSEVKPLFYSKAKQILDEFKAEGIGYEDVEYPDKFKDYFLAQVLPVISSIESHSKKKLK